jgi:hypothetical protein
MIPNQQMSQLVDNHQVLELFRLVEQRRGEGDGIVDVAHRPQACHVSYANSRWREMRATHPAIETLEECSRDPGVPALNHGVMYSHMPHHHGIHGMSHWGRVRTNGLHLASL